MSAAAIPDISGDWLAAMRRGEWEQAWRATDRIELARRAQQRQPGFTRRPEHLRWDGTPLADRIVLVRCEHGLGDTLQFIRFIPQLGARKVHLMVQPHLLKLLRGVPGLGDVHDYWTDDPPPPHEVDIEVMELAYARRATLANLPPPCPGLHLQLPRSGRLQQPGDGRLRVGLLWAASDWDTTRSIPLRKLAPLFSVEDVAFFSLQQGIAARDPLLQQFDIELLSSRTAQIDMAATAMCDLDLVISVDGMPAHLAGTLGRPTWLLLKRDADWRWMDERDDTPWYPTLRLFRQQHDGDWDSVIAQVAHALRDRASAHQQLRALSAETIAR